MTYISIIVPTKNVEETIGDCLDSLQGTRFPNAKYETIVVDAHSTDQTLEIVREYECRVVFDEGDTLGEAKNVGIKIAEGRYIVFIDADCVVEEEWLDELVTVLESSEEIASVGGPNVTPEDDTKFARCVGQVLTFLSTPGSRYGYEGTKVKETFHNPHCNAIYRSSVLEEVGGFNPDLITCEDEELDYRIRKTGYRILYNPRAVLYHYRRPTWQAFARMAYRYSIGRSQTIRLHQGMGRWFHYVPSVVVVGLGTLLVLALLNPLFLGLLGSSLFLGGSGVALMSTYLSYVGDSPQAPVTYFGLICIWFWYWAIGFISGFRKPINI